MRGKNALSTFLDPKGTQCNLVRNAANVKAVDKRTVRWNRQTEY